ncbi:molybdopterin molybdotransferase MoeA [Tabrizicola sp. J26]|uniref:molybdopterin molybdotransferase MoeA n=1 Tax=Alitabrizicola rongguiensis TaxID=2909234 RepID=UPI001F24A6A7|nr:molybdopterin molybdotransferase MoeA [Tabrizicola rongguiensis]MCF1710760.1 molybdopterin molybdotransferase MoeA [Tabrizicola rongguiensis]
MSIPQPVTRTGCGCEGHDANKKLITIDAALDLIGHSLTIVDGTEDICLGKALGRVLADPVRSGSMSPPFDNAAMDGFAFSSAALRGDGPWILDVAARIQAGQSSAMPLVALQAAQIFTGAKVPEGADVVVMQEEVKRTGKTIRVATRPMPGLNIRRAGSEMAAGVTVLEKGRRLDARAIAACAAAGAGFVTVRRRLRVALLVTGNEIRAAGALRAEAQVWDVNTPMLTGILTQPQIDIVTVEQGIDSRDGLFLQIAELAANADLVITTGGISVGEEDHIKPALLALGGDIHFSGVAIKPGKPVSFGRIRGAWWLGLPGNPLSAFVTWQLFGTAIVARLTGTKERVARRHVVTGAAISRKPGRCELRPATRAGFDGQGREVVTFDAETHSGHVCGLSDTDGLILLPADCDVLPEGALVEFLPFFRN